MNNQLGNLLCCGFLLCGLYGCSIIPHNTAEASSEEKSEVPLLEQKASLLIGSLPAGSIIQAQDKLVQKSISYWMANPQSGQKSLFQRDNAGNQITAILLPDGSLLMEIQDLNGNRNEVILQQDSETLRILNTQGHLLRMALLSP